MHPTTSLDRPSRLRLLPMLVAASVCLTTACGDDPQSPAPTADATPGDADAVSGPDTANPSDTGQPADADTTPDVAVVEDAALTDVPTGGDIADSVDSAPDTSPSIDTTTTVTAGPLSVDFRLGDGTFDVWVGERLVIRRATADALLDDGSGPRLVSMAGDCARSVDGQGRFVCEADGVTLLLELALFADDGHIEAALTFENTAPGTLQLLRLSPLVVEAEQGGALQLGPDPTRHRILENGSYIVMDHAAQAAWGDVPRFVFADVLPIPLRGSSVSNWSHVVASIDDPAQSLVAGWLTFYRSVPTLGIAFDASVAIEGDDGARPFTTYAAENALIFHGKPLDPGAALSSERLWMKLLPEDPLAALEHYADAVAAFHDIVPWPQRNGGQDVPNGWNSWTGSGGTGGYGTNIDEALILENLDAFTEELGAFGEQWFQLDDGWEPHYGDWEWRTDRFPSGGAGMAAAIADKGMNPGLWIAAFSVDPDAEIAAEHPDWLQQPEEYSLSDAEPTLDLSKPEVLAHLTDIMTGIREDGWKWVKLDFSYQALLGKPQDTTITAVESWRQGWVTVREALGPDIFLLGIGVMGTNIGIIDAMRLTLDTNPQWESDDPDSAISAENSFKSAARSGSRRWFYQNRVWVNHDDLIFFRASAQKDIPPLTFEESRTFATWVGLGGGIVKIGDKIVDLAEHPDQVDVLRRILPAWPEGARPVDVLVRDYPEHWVLPIHADVGDYTVVGLLNWGNNRDFSVRPEVDIPDGPHDYTISCEGECLVWDFWEEQLLGVVTGDLAVQVPAHDSKVLALRTPTGAPQLLGTNRHITMGATDMGAITWDADDKTLSGTLLGAVGSEKSPWEYRLAFHAPSPLQVVTATVDGVAEPVLQQDGEVVRLSFSLPADKQGQTVAFALSFE